MDGIQKAFLNAKADQSLKSHSDITGYCEDFARKYPYLAPLYFLDRLKIENGVISRMPDKAVNKSRREHMMSGPNLMSPTVRYFKSKYASDEHLTQLRLGKITYDQVASRCEIEEDHCDVRTKLVFAMTPSRPDQLWACKDLADIERTHEIFNAAVMGAATKFVAAGCDWPLTPGCDGRFSPVFVVPLPRPSDFIVFCKVCKYCWDTFVEENEISAKLGTGLIPG